jgi:hypothetical protein
MTGFWLLPKPAQRLNTNDDDYVVAFTGISLYRSVTPPSVHPHIYVCHLFTE